MLRLVCRSKIHGAVITKKDMNYSGSIGIDKKILQACGLNQYEVVQVLNFNNTNRFETYIIEEESGSGIIALYGPAARLGEPGDKLVILAYGIIDEGEAEGFKINVVKVDQNNRIIKK